MARKTSSRIDSQLLVQLPEGQDLSTVLSSEGLPGDLKKTLAQRMLKAEMDPHLERHFEQQGGDHGNGSSRKTVLSEDGARV